MNKIETLNLTELIQAPEDRPYIKYGNYMVCYNVIRATKKNKAGKGDERACHRMCYSNTTLRAKPLEGVWC